MIDLPRHIALEHGIANPAETVLIPRPSQVWQLVGVKPDVATWARDEVDARERLAVMLGRAMTEADVVKRVRESCTPKPPV